MRRDGTESNIVLTFQQGQRKHFKGGEAKSEHHYSDGHLHRPGSTFAIENYSQT